jgi:hypothetical protein
MIKNSFSKSKYIEDLIIKPLKEWEEGNISEHDTEWWRLTDEVRRCKEMNIMDELHKQLIPFYEKYLYAEHMRGKGVGHLFEKFINDAAKLDSQFPTWAESNDLVVITESWADTLRSYDGSIFYYISVVRLLLEQGYDTDWRSLSEQLKTELHKAEVYSDYKTGELMCFLHGVAMLMNTLCSDDKKMENFNLLCDNWDFLKHFYSVMIRRIIGCRLPNFIAVANLVAQQPLYHQYIHLFYCALCYRQDTLGLKKKQLKSFEEKLVRIHNIMDETKPSDMLNKLCDTLFPEDFQRMLDEFRPETRDEIERERNKLRYEVGILTEQMTSMAEKLKDALEHSVPIADIEHQLLRLSPGAALDLCAKLTVMLSHNQAWMTSMPDIQEKILQKKEEQDRQMSELLLKISEKQPVNVNVGAGGTAQITERDIVNQPSGLLE